MYKLIVRDKDTYYEVHISESNAPYCPVCEKAMSIASSRRGETTWKCLNYSGAPGILTCPLIEGRLDRRTNMLWGCKYEARPINSS